MPFTDRSELYKEIEQIRGRPLISYVTSLRINASGAMGPDVITEFPKHLRSIDSDKKKIDILIISNGGDPVVPWRIMTMLREQFDEVGVLVPFVAYSAATLLALGANEIVMHPFANLGPVDPQIANIQKNISFGYEDIRYFLEFVRNDVKISDQAQLRAALELLGRDIDVVGIGTAKRSSQLSLSLGEALLKLHMDDDNQAASIAESLNRSFYHHSYTLGPKEAEGIGLPITRATGRLADLMWNVWRSFEDDMQCAVPFDPQHVVFQSDQGTELLESIQQVEMPVNLPPQLAQQVYQQILQNVNVKSISPIDYVLFIAALESINGVSRYLQEGKIVAALQPNMNIGINVFVMYMGWFFEKI